MKVTILTITYNHEPYLAQALESFLMQQTDFDFEILISDDFSADDTRRICLEYQAKYPDKIRLILREKNIGMMPNFIDSIYQTRGTYVALCEGDDYWNDPLKLQKQVDYLDAHDEVVISAHKSYALSEGQFWNYHEIKQYNKNKLHTHYTVEDYIVKDFFHTSSIVFRKKTIEKFPDWYYNVFGGDYFLVLQLAMHGDIHFMNETLSVYRQNTNSVSHYHSRVEIYENYLKHFRIYDEFSGKKYTKVINRKIFTFRFYLNYYHPSYLHKIGFYCRNFFNIWRIDARAVPASGKIKFLIPAQWLRDKVDINRKKTKSS